MNRLHRLIGPEEKSAYNLVYARYVLILLTPSPEYIPFLKPSQHHPRDLTYPRPPPSSKPLSTLSRCNMALRQQKTGVMQPASPKAPIPPHPSHTPLCGSYFLSEPQHNHIFMDSPHTRGTDVVVRDLHPKTDSCQLTSRHHSPNLLILLVHQFLTKFT